MPSLKLVALILALSLSAVAQAASDNSGLIQSAPATTTSAGALPEGGNEERAKLTRELQAIKQDLPAKKQELVRLHRKWLVAKGRTPTENEKKAYEKKVASGKATFQDNPYINRNPLGNPAPARIAYYKKLEEVKRDEERIRQLERELNP